MPKVKFLYGKIAFDLEYKDIDINDKQIYKNYRSKRSIIFI